MNVIFPHPQTDLYKKNVDVDFFLLNKMCLNYFSIGLYACEFMNVYV